MVSLSEFVSEINGKDVRKVVETADISKKYATLSSSKDIVGELFPNNKMSMTREQIFNEKDTRKKLIMILVWGYPSDTRNTPTIIENISKLVELQSEYENGTISGEQYLKDLLAVRRLGLSTATKILYFMNVSIVGHPCIIADARVEAALPLIKEFTSIKRGEDIPFYKKFIGKVDDVARQYGLTQDGIEYFLFNLGKVWEDHMGEIQAKEVQNANKIQLEILLKALA